MKFAVVAQALDLVTFPFAVAIWGIGGEWNPLIVYSYAVSGLMGVFVIKTVGTILAIHLARYLRSWRRKAAIIAIGTVGAVGALTNTVAILLG
jgi:hypothetical protein